ncbi:MAG: tetratricopeptide repeat protein [Pseudomonadota bacterium]
MKRFHTLVAVFALVPVLGGCALFKPSLRAEVQVKVPEQYSGKQYGEDQLALGGQKLDEGAYGQAIIAFSNVRHYPEHAAAAHNGLAIAYSQIGRHDLAERYFRQAMAEAPSDARYQANLSRFYDAVPAIAVRSPLTVQPAAVPQLARAQVLANAAGQPLVKIELPAGRMVRVSSNEVRIEGAAPFDVRRGAPQRQMALAPAIAGPTQRRRAAVYPLRLALKAAE